MTACEIVVATALDKPDWFNLIAIERGCPKRWRWFQSEWRGETRQQGVFIVKGGVDGAAFKSGKYKGKPNPAKRTDVRELVITNDDMLAIQKKWERSTGKCSRCNGSGRELRGWSQANGEQLIDCKRCNATGQASEPAS